MLNNFNARKGHRASLGEARSILSGASARTYALSLGARAIADINDGVGARLVHNLQFERAREWGRESLASDPDKLGSFLCQLALFRQVYGDDSHATDAYLEAVQTSDPESEAFQLVVASALAHSLGAFDVGFATKLLEQLKRRPGSTLRLSVRGHDSEISLPCTLLPSVAEDVVAIVFTLYFGLPLGADHRDPPLKNLLRDMREYLDAVDANAGISKRSAGGSASRVADIGLASLALLARRAKGLKLPDEIGRIRIELGDFISIVGKPLEAYSPAVAEYVRTLRPHIVPPRSKAARFLRRER